MYKRQVYVERDAGQGSGFEDERYRAAGGQIVYSVEEVYGRAQMILTVSRPTLPEFELLQEGHILVGFLHLAVSHPGKVETLLERKVTAIAYETIQEPDGHLPVLAAPSQIAGRMIPPIAAQLLQNNEGGHGILLSGVPGVPPAHVVILGAGFAWLRYARDPVPTVAPQGNLLTQAARNDLYQDQVNEGLLMRPGIHLTRALDFLDRRGVDGADGRLRARGLDSRAQAAIRLVRRRLSGQGAEVDDLHALPPRRRARRHEAAAAQQVQRWYLIHL